VTAIDRWNSMMSVVKTMTYEQALAIVDVTHMQIADPELYMAATLRAKAGQDPTTHVPGEVEQAA
jgi:hypothetical protein